LCHSKSYSIVIGLTSIALRKAKIKEIAIFVVGKVGGDEMEALSYSTTDVDKARAFIEDALKRPLDDELKALLEEKITKDTKEDIIYKTRKDEYSLIVKRTTETDTKARYAISVTTDKEVFERLSK
jgi:hypothetical protein